MITSQKILYSGREWEIRETKNKKMIMGDMEIDIPASWHLISKICTISMPKNENETFDQFKRRLKEE